MRSPSHANSSARLPSHGLSTRFSNPPTTARRRRGIRTKRTAMIPAWITSSSASGCRSSPPPWRTVVCNTSPAAIAAPFSNIARSAATRASRRWNASENLIAPPQSLVRCLRAVQRFTTAARCTARAQTPPTSRVAPTSSPFAVRPCPLQPAKCFRGSSEKSRQPQSAPKLGKIAAARSVAVPVASGNSHRSFAGKIKRRVRRMLGS